MRASSASEEVGEAARDELDPDVRGLGGGESKVSMKKFASSRIGCESQQPIGSTIFTIRPNFLQSERLDRAILLLGFNPYVHVVYVFTYSVQPSHDHGIE